MLANPVVAPAVANDAAKIRLIGRKMATIKENAEAQTTAKRTSLTNAMPGNRECIEGATYMAAGNAAVGNGGNQRQPLPMHGLVIIQAELTDVGPVGGPANWECDADMIQLADNNKPAMIFQKTTTPHGRVLPNGTQFLEFVSVREIRLVVRRTSA